MANYLHRTTKQYTTSVSPNSLPEPEANYVVNPDISAVEEFPSIYWIITGDVVTLMSLSERDTVDADIVIANDLADKESEKGRIDVEKVLIALAIVIKNEINLLRAEHSLAARTLSQLKTAIKNEIDNQ